MIRLFGKQKLLRLSVLVPLIASCTSQYVKNAEQGASTFGDYLRQDNFTAFVPFRTQDGAGTTVSFDKNGEETIIASATECLPPASVAPVTQAVATMVTDATVSSSADIGASYAVTTGNKLNVSGTVGIANTAKIKFELIEPFTTRITLVSALNYMNSLPKESACRRELTSPKNVVIHTVLGAKGVSYSFYDSNDNKLTITAAMLSAIKATPSLKASSEGTTSLTLKDTPVFLGYRAWKGSQAFGASTNQIELTELTPSDVARIRQLSK